MSPTIPCFQAGVGAAATGAGAGAAATGAGAAATGTEAGASALGAEVVAQPCRIVKDEARVESVTTEISCLFILMSLPSITLKINLDSLI
ncbi:MAG: hypothetical protein FJY58_04065 [Betaproteobacteria bacterium]|nr:hypothetical protein [Betaproteobacteria bacterium]